MRRDGTRVSNVMRVGGLCLLVGFLGCGGAADERQPAAQDQAELFKTVEIKLAADGSRVKREFFQTAAQRAAEKQARLKMRERLRDGVQSQALESEITPITTDIGCSDGYALWLWPEFNEEGERCCLSGTGEDDIPSLCPFTRVRSYYPGSQGGDLVNESSCWQPTFEPWGPSENIVNCTSFPPNYVYIYP